MDRAHRLGQRRHVSVYRVLTRGTLEEKIMSLQRFKIDVANAVVNQDNISLRSMDTGRLLDLFQVPGGQQQQPKVRAGPAADGVDSLGNVTAGAAGGAGGRGLAAMLESVEGLWDDSVYQEEFNLDSFMQRLRK